MNGPRRFAGCVALLLAAAVQAADKPVVTVLYFDNDTGNAEYEVLRKGLADMMVSDLVAWDGVTVVERERLEAVLGELKLQRSKAFDKTTAVKVGKLIGAQYLISGKLFAAGSTLRLDATVVKVDTGVVLANATVSDQKDKIFELEQKLVEGLTGAIDSKLRGDPQGRKKAKVANLDTLLAYSKAIDLSDQGRLDEAQQAIAAVVSKSPTFLMARERKEAILKQLQEYEKRRKDLVSGSALALGKKVDGELDERAAFGSLDRPKQERRLLLRLLRGRFLARLLKQSLSFRSESLRVIRPGKEAEALKALRAWAENQRRFDEDAAEYSRTYDTTSSFTPGDAALAELARDASMGTLEVRVDGENLAVGLVQFLIRGRLDDGADFTVAPPLAVLDPREQKAALELLDETVDAAFAAREKAPAGKKQGLEFAMASTTEAKAAILEYLGRDDDAVGAYQRFLDAAPSNDRASWMERSIKRIIGAESDNDRSNRERWAKALQGCDDMDIRVGMSYTRSLQRLGLAGLDADAAALEKACGGWPRLGDALAQFYRQLASDAATHEDCTRAKKYYQKAYEADDDLTTLQGYMKNEPWCDYRFSADTLPSKVRVAPVSEGHATEALRAFARALPEVFEEELAARGLAVETGGTSHGGTLGMWVSLDSKARPMVVKTHLSRSDAGGDLDHAVPVNGGQVDLAALAAPYLKALRAGADPGPRKPLGTVSMDLLVQYALGCELLESRKWDEAQHAFDELLKKHPHFRLAKVRSAMAAAGKRDHP